MDAGRTFDGCATGSFVSFELFAEIVGRAPDVIRHLKEENEWLKSQRKRVPRGQRGNLSHVENCIENLRADLRGMNVEGSIEKVRADLKEIGFERPIEMLKDEMSTELVQDESNG
ncbi:hypothetical protein SLEP1_g51845 [Rubroshorea leprosula]|uniref:Uncharacterized protein n=1 Tax=Rubroshorea leprosula TaxID=152421 RepID=A0AAV5M5C0_9ROSI|nr:hypothetical protein SLEP1_g51845 [Rubroshorea leprosula]